MDAAHFRLSLLGCVLIILLRAVATDWRRRTVVFLVPFAAVSIACTTWTRAEGPGSDQELILDPNFTFASPDRKIQLLEYSKNSSRGFVHQFWTFAPDGQRFLLNPDESDDLAGYPAGFRFSPDSQWVVRMQKLGSGCGTLFLYKRKDNQFLPATQKLLGDQAWDYFFSLPDSRGIIRNPNDRFSLDHADAVLVQGMDDNYSWMGEKWPDSRYVVISLSFDTQGQKPGPWIEAWRCVYDLKTGQFSVPPDFIDHNVSAYHTPDESPVLLPKADNPAPQQNAPDSQPPKSSGSGAVISAEGLILTAAHVVKRANRIVVVTTTGRFDARVVRIDSATDLAVLKCDGKNFSPLPFATRQTARLGQEVFTLGFPNIGVQGFSPKFTKGEISSVTGMRDDPREWQVSVPIQPGNSGGPLCDQDGNIIGIIVATLNPIAMENIAGEIPQNVNYAIKSSYIFPMISDERNLPQPRSSQSNAKIEDVVGNVEPSIVLILVY